MYHISFFYNTSSQDIVTANPRAQRDTYFVQAGKGRQPDNFVEINMAGGWKTYAEAFPHANFIYTGTLAYCFWDNKDSGIDGFTTKDPKIEQRLYRGGAGNLRLTVNADGTISFSNVP